MITKDSLVGGGGERNRWNSSGKATVAWSVFVFMERKRSCCLLGPALSGARKKRYMSWRPEPIPFFYRTEAVHTSREATNNAIGNTHTHTHGSASNSNKQFPQQVHCRVINTRARVIFDFITCNFILYTFTVYILGSTYIWSM